MNIYQLIIIIILNSFLFVGCDNKAKKIDSGPSEVISSKIIGGSEVIPDDHPALFSTVGLSPKYGDIKVRIDFSVESEDFDEETEPWYIPEVNYIEFGCDEALEKFDGMIRGEEFLKCKFIRETAARNFLKNDLGWVPQELFLSLGPKGHKNTFKVTRKAWRSSISNSLDSQSMLEDLNGALEWIDGPRGGEVKTLRSGHNNFNSKFTIRKRANDISCTGVLVSRSLVVTAAHCLKDLDPSRHKVDIYFTKNRKNSNGKILEAIESSEWKTHPKYGVLKFSSMYDIGWIRLNRSAPEWASPMDIINGENYLNSNLQMEIAGYGITESEDDERYKYSLIKRITSVPFNNYYDDQIFGSLIEYRFNGTGACRGDSGGPAYAKIENNWGLIGITHGTNPLLHLRRNSCKAKGLYTHVGSYVSWLEKSSGEKLGVIGSQPSKQRTSTWPHGEVSVDSFKELCEKTTDLTLDEILAKYVFLFITRAPNCEKAFSKIQAGSSGAVLNIVETDRLYLNMRWVAETFPGLTYVNIITKDANGIKEIAEIAKLTQLETLRLEGQNVDNSFVKKISTLENLGHLNLTGSQVSNVDSLASLKNLRKLELANNNIDNVDSLVNLPKLETILLRGNPVLKRKCPFSEIKKSLCRAWPAHLR